MEKDNALGYQGVDIYNRDNYYQISRVNPLLIKHLKKVRDKKALDIGCGNGINGRYMRELGYDVLGIDINPNAIQLTKDFGVKAELTDICEFSWSQNYDLITSFYFLQHLSHKKATRVLEDAFEHLNPNGILALGIFTDRENGLTAKDMQLLLKQKTSCTILDYDEWEREDRDHGIPHTHKGYYCVCRKDKDNFR